MSKRLDNIDWFRKVLVARLLSQKSESPFEAEAVYCPRCQSERRVEVCIKHLEPDVDQVFLAVQRVAFAQGSNRATSFEARLKERGIAPSLFTLRCLQCNSGFVLVAHKGPAAEEVSIIPSVEGGISTRHSPPGVAYYLDQAYRAQRVNARSAAIAMYRSALEHLLHDQGYTKGMCGERLKALEKDIQAGTAPAWASRGDTDFMTILKDLGNGVLHTNGGDITLQENATPDLVEEISVSFAALLEEVYERPAEEKARKDRLSEVRAKFGKQG